MTTLEAFGYILGFTIGGTIALWILYFASKDKSQ